MAKPNSPSTRGALRQERSKTGRTNKGYTPAKAAARAAKRQG